MPLEPLLMPHRHISCLSTSSWETRGYNLPPQGNVISEIHNIQTYSLISLYFRQQKKYTNPDKTIKHLYVILPQFPHHSEVLFRSWVSVLSGLKVLSRAPLFSFFSSRVCPLSLHLSFLYLLWVPLYMSIQQLGTVIPRLGRHACNSLRLERTSRSSNMTSCISQATFVIVRGWSIPSFTPFWFHKERLWGEKIPTQTSFTIMICHPDHLLGPEAFVILILRDAMTRVAQREGPR